MQQLVDGLTVSSIRQRLFEQPAQAAKVAFEATQFQPGFLMFQAGHGEAEAYPLTEGRK